MFVDEVILVSSDNRKDILEKYPFLEKHPHLCLDKRPNIIFISQRYYKLNFNRKAVLAKLDVDKVKRSIWELPSFFNHPNAYTYIKNFKLSESGKVIMKTPDRGQEFILDLNEVPYQDREEVIKFVQDLIVEAKLS